MRVLRVLTRQWRGSPYPAGAWTRFDWRVRRPAPPEDDAIMIENPHQFEGPTPDQASRLKRPIHPITDFIRDALDAAKLTDQYKNRPDTSATTTSAG